MNRSTTILAIGLIFWIACQNTSTADKSEEKKPSGVNLSDDDECGIEDGTQSATIDYYNPATGYSATYSLHVEVENCQVIQIDFNNCGYLDEDHIEPADIDENGDASIQDDRGRRFEVHLEK